MLRSTRAALANVNKVARVATVVAPRASIRQAFGTASRYQQPSAALITRITPRNYGTSASSRVVEEPARIVDYAAVKKIVNGNDSNIVLVDVREPSEYDAGHIGNAINIPFKSMPGALGLDAAEFESTLGFAKPSTDKTLLFYCLGGVRSTSSEQLASTYGYKNRMNYLGSYQDWLQNEGSGKS